MKTQAKRSHAKILRSLVVYGNERTGDIGDILRIARAEIQKKEHTRETINIRTLRFVPECSCYIALYTVPSIREGET